jgi:hypothetical protein
MRKLLFALATGIIMAGCARKPPAAAPQPKTITRPVTRPSAAPVPRDTAPELPAPDVPTNLRPVQVSVCEFTAPAAAARVVIEHYGASSCWWSARCNAEGQATILMPIELNRFRVNAVKPPYAIVSTNLFNLPANNAPVPVTLVLSQTGVVITAQISAPRPALLSNLTIRIQPSNNADWQHVGAARVEDVAGATHVLPPIRPGLAGLRVAVASPRCALSLSQLFDTRDGEDKTVPVTLLEGAVVRGRAVREDGTPLASFRVDGEPTEVYDLPRGAGAVHETLTTGADGSYACGTFLPNFYRLHASCDQAQAITTNLLVDAEGTWLDLVFPPPRYRTINGKVLIERSKEPVANAVVLWDNGTRCATTDVAGVFALQVRDEDDYFYGHLSVRQPGYADAKRYVDDEYHGQVLLLLLHEAGHITGTVRNGAGLPVSGVYVQVRVLSSFHSGRARVALGSEQDAWREEQALHYSSARGSDAAGAYVISNVAAPKTYCADLYGQHFRLVWPAPNTAAVNVRAGMLNQCELVVAGIPFVLVKLLDAQGLVVRDYELQVQYRYSDRGSSGSGSMHAEADADGWVSAPDWCLREPGILLDFAATSPDGWTAATNGLRLTDSGTNFVVLMAGASNSLGLCGYVYDSDDAPLPEVSLYAYQESTQSTLGNAETDPLGFFEFAAAGDTTSGPVRLHVWIQQYSYSTNVMISSEPIIWRLPPVRAVRGRVCLERPDAPVTNFAVSLDMDNGKRAFHAVDGRFRLPVDDDYATTGVVYAWVEDYAPAQAAFCLDAQGQCDVGDIIVSATASTLRGRVVNERMQPLSAQVSLAGAGDRALHVNARSDAENGRYEFTRLPTGTYLVSAWKNGTTSGARSEWIALGANAVVDVPDLVLQMTNAALVRIVFVMADGTPAAGMRVGILNDAATDMQGAIEEYIRIGHYENVCLYRENERYYTEPFDVAAGTRELRVKLLALDTIAGTVTLDGQPLAHGYLALSGAQGRDFSCNVREGAFSLQATPGTYVVVCQNIKAYCTANLVAGDQNNIAFVSGTASLHVTFPFTAHWGASLQVAVDGRNIPIDFTYQDNTTTFELNALPAGDYELSCWGRMGESHTNVQAQVTLAPGAHATISF